MSTEAPWRPSRLQSNANNSEIYISMITLLIFLSSLSFFFRTVSWPIAIYLISAGKLFFSSVLKAGLISLKIKWG